MPIVGGKVTKVDAEKMNDAPVTSLEFGFNLEDVRMDKKVLVMPYTTVITYAPSVARIIVKGELYVEVDEKKAKEVISMFKESKRLPEELTEEVITSINFASVAVGTLAAFAIGVNAPLNVPRAKLQSSGSTAMPAGSAPKAS